MARWLLLALACAALKLFIVAAVFAHRPERVPLRPEERSAGPLEI